MPGSWGCSTAGSSCSPTSRPADRASPSAQRAGVPERVATGLRPDAEPVRAAADADAVQETSAARADRVDLAVEAARQPEDPPVGRDAAHVGAAAARQPPRVDDAAGAK